MAAAVAKASVQIGDGLMPLDYLLQVLRDDEMEPGTRIDAAKAAAPYCHKKMATEVDVKGMVKLRVVNDLV